MTRKLYQLLAGLPLAWLYAMSSCAAFLLQHVFRYRRKDVKQNLEQAFPDWSDATIQATRKNFYQNLCDTAFEIIAGSRQPLAFFEQRIKVINPELLADLSENGQQSVFVMLAHQGNWEWMLHRAAALYDLPMAFVYKRLHSQAADEFSLQARQRFGATAIEMRDTARNIIRRRRTPRLIYMLADQSPGLRERVHTTEFLNRETAFFSGAATLARATGFPVAFARCQRRKRGHFEVELVEITRDPASVEETWILERYAELTETAIRACPDDWLWSNRRWKHQAPTASTLDKSAPPDTDNQSNPES
ncbi:MAG: lysophospholipid acyltransferase family protein [Luminiphilus sp.]|nr:lysophospholipid acyltransferase family protein [Luminiphilus sp.]